VSLHFGQGYWVQTNRNQAINKMLISHMRKQHNCQTLINMEDGTFIALCIIAAILFYCSVMIYDEKSWLVMSPVGGQLDEN